MHLSLALLLSSSTLLFVDAAALRRRAVVCGDLSSALASAGTSATTYAQSYCRQYLALSPVTTTLTATNVVATAQITSRTTVTSVRTVTPVTLTITQTSKVTKAITITPATSTITQVVTSHAYLDGAGNTLGVLKRDSNPELERRAMSIPQTFVDLGYIAKADIRAACACLSLTRGTVTRRATVRSTTTTNLGTVKTNLRTTTLAVPLTTITSVTTAATKTMTLPAPLATVTSYLTQQVYSCLPGTTTRFLCPQGTGDDDGSMTDANELACPAFQPTDGFSGYCAYFADDGSPDTSLIWTLDDGTGNLATRSPVFDDTDDADCPAWADFTCQPAGHRKREESDTSDPKDSSLVARAKGSKKGRKLKKMPIGLKKGAQYVPWEEAKEHINHEVAHQEL